MTPTTDIKEVSDLQDTMTETAHVSLASTLYRVAVRLPHFWPNRPALWFAHAKAQFDLAGITRQSTKFNYLVSKLHQKHAAEVEDITIRRSTSPITGVKQIWCAGCPPHSNSV